MRPEYSSSRSYRNVLLQLINKYKKKKDECISFCYIITSLGNKSGLMTISHESSLFKNNNTATSLSKTDIFPLKDLSQNSSLKCSIFEGSLVWELSNRLKIAFVLKITTRQLNRLAIFRTIALRTETQTSQFNK